ERKASVYLNLETQADLLIHRLLDMLGWKMRNANKKLIQIIELTSLFTYFLLSSILSSIVAEELSELIKRRCELNPNKSYTVVGCIKST
ncbi:MAG: hypothetical protein OXC80_09665, partial [Gammaproteobacteria bacterium]|nr:hypothetical protein [Gammaproteobacteria bacterium]